MKRYTVHILCIVAVLGALAVLATAAGAARKAKTGLIAETTTSLASFVDSTLNTSAPVWSSLFGMSTAGPGPIASKIEVTTGAVVSSESAYQMPVMVRVIHDYATTITISLAE